MKNQDLLTGLGSTIRQLRRSRNLTLRDLAKIVECTAGYLSQIENETVNPSIATIKKIASALGVNIVELFMEEEPADEKIVIKNGEGFKIKYVQGDASVFLLTKTLKGKIMEPILARFLPGGGSYGLYSHPTGQEFGYIIKGTLELKVGDKVYALKKGDSFYFDSTRPHGYTNNGKEVTEVLWVISPPG